MTAVTSTKPEQVLIIEPRNELRFRGPFTSQITSYMKLQNPIDKRVFFKIKTTAPKKYCVRPNCGVLEPKVEVTIAVSLQPFEYDPQEKNKHKFMVQSIIAPDADSTVDNVWLKAKPSDSMDSKLKCVFEMPAEDEGVSEEPAVESARKRLPESKPAAASLVPDSSADAGPDAKQMRSEEATLRKLNMSLKEDVLRLQRQLDTLQAQRPQHQQALQEMPEGFTMAHYAIMIVIALVGIILGKFIL